MAKFLHGSFYVVHCYDNRRLKAFLDFWGRVAYLCAKHIWRQELMREGINLSRSFAENKLQTTCNLTTRSLTWSDSKGSSTSWSCTNWRLWEKDMSTVACIKWLLWSFSVVHNGAQVQTGRAFSFTPCPFLIGSNVRLQLMRACCWRTVLQSSKLLLANTFQVIHYSGHPPAIRCLPFLTFLSFVSLGRQHGRRKMLLLSCS